ncbi:MAG: DUF1566 domain-containing protein [Methylovulum sp.]|nr:DUF1566 domain-containing protein [Methylovulum sp.]
MKINGFNVALALSCLLMVTVSHAKCWKGIDCHEDLPSKESPAPAPTSTAEDWQMLDRYQVKGGLVKDPITGLMWMRCSFGQTWDGSTCSGETTQVTWEQAMNLPKRVEYAGYSDWRVPSYEELHGLVYCSSGEKETKDDGRWDCGGDYARPAIVQAVFPNTSRGSFWSSSPIANPSKYAWYVNFSFGYSNWYNKSNNNYVRLVRSEQ